MLRIPLPSLCVLSLAAALGAGCGGAAGDPGGSAGAGGADPAGGVGGAAPAGGTGGAGALPSASSASRIWGVTVDDPWNLAPTVDALARLPVRSMARVVFDEGQAASSYAPIVPQIHAVSDVMGELLDSYYVNTLSTEQYAARQRDYLDALGDSVDVWEVGNEINGEWLGGTADVVAKVASAYELVKARGKRAAVTLYQNQGCWSSADHEMLTWAAANLPASMREGLDYVWVSYYEDDCNGLQPDWPTIFARLAELFPNARLGIGECGTAVAASKAATLTRYYSMQVSEPRFVGGFFWWYFSEDMVPASTPLWQRLHDLVLAGG